MLNIRLDYEYRLYYYYTKQVYIYLYVHTNKRSSIITINLLCNINDLT